jgi:exodeoxyribonuclease-5
VVDRLGDFAVCAYTGKAVDRLKQCGMDAAATIHSTIYAPSDDESSPDGVRFVPKTKEEIGCKGFIVDEGSMVGKDELAVMQSYRLPIIVFGDHGQLPPVGEDAGLMKEPMYRLETIHRNAGPIARFAEHLRLGKEPKDWPSGDGVFVAKKKQVTDQHLLNADQVICAFNRTRVGLNKTIRRLLGRPDEPVVGDRVICLQNDKLAGCFNGQQGTLEVIEPLKDMLIFKPRWGYRLTVGYHPQAWNSEKPPKRERWTEPGRLIPFDYAYAVTCHKAQGDEFPALIVFEERCDLWEHKRWCYTAASRAKEKILWLMP